MRNCREWQEAFKGRTAVQLQGFYVTWGTDRRRRGVDGSTRQSWHLVIPLELLPPSLGLRDLHSHWSAACAHAQSPRSPLSTHVPTTHHPKGKSLSVLLHYNSIPSRWKHIWAASPPAKRLLCVVLCYFIRSFGAVLLPLHSTAASYTSRTLSYRCPCPYTPTHYSMQSRER